MLRSNSFIKEDMGDKSLIALSEGYLVDHRFLVLQVPLFLVVIVVLHFRVTQNPVGVIVHVPQFLRGSNAIAKSTLAPTDMRRGWVDTHSNQASNL